LATVVNKNFINNTTATQALYEFVTGDLMLSNSPSQDAIATSRYALNCPVPAIIVDLRKLNGRPKNELFNPFWARWMLSWRDVSMIVAMVSYLCVCIVLPCNLSV